MELPNRATELTLEQFPPYPLPDAAMDKTEHLAKYLLDVVSENLTCPNSEMYFPSLCQMAIFFHLSEMKTYDAFLSLRKRGYDFSLEGLSNAVRVWCK